MTTRLMEHEAKGGGKAHCVSPPNPGLAVERDQALPATGSADLVDARSCTLIAARPKRTRPNTFVSTTRGLAPITDVNKALVLLVDFYDAEATKDPDHFNEMMFSTGAYTGGSMRDFFREVSYGNLDVTGEVSGQDGPTAGWYRAPNLKSYYTSGNYGFGAHPQNAQKLVEDVIDLAAPHVNFAEYADSDTGVVEALIIIAAGLGAEDTENTGDIWSHK